MNEMLYDDLNEMVLKFSKKYEDKLALFFCYYPIIMSMTRERGIPFHYFDTMVHRLVINDNEFPITFDLWVESRHQNDNYNPLVVIGNIGVCKEEFNSVFNNPYENIPISAGNKRFIFDNFDPMDIEKWLFETVLHYCYNMDIEWLDDRRYKIGNYIDTFYTNPIEW